jgi:hypothetical protein
MFGLVLTESTKRRRHIKEGMDELFREERIYVLRSYLLCASPSSSLPLSYPDPIVLDLLYTLVVLPCFEYPSPCFVSYILVLIVLDLSVSLLDIVVLKKLLFHHLVSC